MYTPLKDESQRDSQEGEDYEALLSQQETLHRKKKSFFWISILSIPIASFCLLGLGAWIGSRWLANPNAICPAHVQHYSPILKEVDTSLHNVYFNGSFMKENAFRLNAGPEVDAAWESLGIDYRSVAVPADEAAKSGLKSDQVHINEKYGGGYPANVEGLHHLHCLNLVRQSLYYNYDYYHAKGEGAFKNDDNIVRFHVSHCLDIVRQQLMCNPDTGLLGQVWWDPAAPKAFVDFNTEHRCKNFDAIRQWAEERQMPETVPMDFLSPPKVGDRVYEAIP